MKRIDKIKSMTQEELIKFLVDFEVDEVAIEAGYCKKHCPNRKKCSEDDSYMDNCSDQDYSETMKLWLNQQWTD